MKKYLLILFLITGMASNVHAQLDSSINDELRAMLINLKRANCAAPFLYDLSIHMSKNVFYKKKCFDTSNAYNWWQIYFEMYPASYTKNLLVVDSVLMDVADSIYDEEDKVPLGLMDFDFNLIRSDAFDSTKFGVWYTWNDSQIFDNPVRITEPFVVNPEESARGTCNEMFTFSPLQPSYRYRDVTFTFDPANFVFYQNPKYSANVQNHPAPHKFQIDFADGNGWVDVDPYNYSEHNILYPSSGDYYLKARVLVDLVTEYKFSIAAFEIETDEISVAPDFTINDIEGLDIGVFRNCHDSSSLLKPVIILSGIDIMENTKIKDIYSGILQYNRILMLKNYGYDFVIVDWDNSKVDMKQNANAVVNLLERLKEISDPNHQFIMVGHSMGGVIGRFALTFMETEQYQINIQTGARTGFDPRRMHNTRLFISIDAPHQGANVPLAYQHLVDWFYAVPRPIFRASFALNDMFRNTKKFNKNFLKATAVKQLLIFHRNTRSGSGVYTSTTERQDFMNDLQALNPASNGWPIYCKKMALTNGLMDGSKQIGYQDDTLKGNDEILHFDKIAITGTLLSQPLLPVYYQENLSLKGMPNGSGDIINCPAALTPVCLTSLKGCFTNILKRKTTPCTVGPVQLPFNVNVSSGIPIETFPGGTAEAGGMITTLSGNYKYPENKQKALKIWFKFKFWYDDWAGTFEIQNRYLNAIYVNMKIQGFSEMPDFCFIPMQSALDYRGVNGLGNPLPQTFNIDAETVANNMNRTPFDVIVGWTPNPVCYRNTIAGANVYSGWSCHNRPHGTVRRDVFGYSGFGVPTDPYAINYFVREIGDSVMLLENMLLNRKSIYQAQNTITAGTNLSPSYSYPTVAGINRFADMFSRDSGFTIDTFSNGYAEFIAGRSIRLRPGFRAKRNSRFWAHIDTMNVCYRTQQENGGDVNSFAVGIDQIDQKETNTGIKVYPNPSTDQIIIDASVEIIKKITIFDLSGKIIFEHKPLEQLTIQKVSGQFEAGFYIIMIETDNKNYLIKHLIE